MLLLLRGLVVKRSVNSFAIALFFVNDVSARGRTLNPLKS
jgi:hypothetical protein